MLELEVENDKWCPLAWGQAVQGVDVLLGVTGRLNWDRTLWTVRRVGWHESMAFK
jgi:hypothetical protein